MYQLGDIVSASEIQKQFKEGDVELCTRKKLLVEIALYKSDHNLEQGKGYSVLLGFEEVDTPEKESIYGNVVHFSQGGTDLESVLWEFGIGADEKVWVVGDPDG